MWGPVGLVVLWVGAPELTETKSCSGIFWTCFRSSDITQYGSHLASECRGPCYRFVTFRWSTLPPLHWGLFFWHQNVKFHFKYIHTNW